jgi:hypothetical protein
MHEWQFNFRKSNHISLTPFLTEYLHHEPTAYLKGLLCRTGKSSNPSTKPGTVGFSLRKALREVFASTISENKVEAREELDFRIAFEDWILECSLPKDISQMFFEENHLAVSWKKPIDERSNDTVRSIISNYNDDALENLRVPEGLAIKNQWVQLLSCLQSPF